MIPAIFLLFLVFSSWLSRFPVLLRALFSGGRLRLRCLALAIFDVSLLSGVDLVDERVFEMDAGSCK